MNGWHELDRQCTATSKGTGERCARAPIPGGSVCASHGGKAPMTIAAAKERLLFMVEPAMEALHRILLRNPPCEVCGRSDDDKNPVVVRAAQIVLDRCGFGPHATITLEPAPSPYSNLSNDQMIEHLEKLLAVARRTRDSQQLIERASFETAGAIDGDVFIVPEDDEPPTGSGPQPDRTQGEAK
jgi:hypothetical protein